MTRGKLFVPIVNVLPGLDPSWNATSSILVDGRVVRLFHVPFEEQLVSRYGIRGGV